ncbi:hypothetical protein Sjap_000239 [Stephania japonica]|uniref:E2 ubiquitin-conjugating enzyme n=1 Tax=Stephania japonica TaxID=461633 RepID=A0AAP0KJU5_9MAGN
MELPSESDCDSFSDSSDSEFLDDIDSMYDGKAQTLLSNLERSIGKIDDFLSFETGFVHGDIVCSVNDPSGQLGQVVDVDMIVDLETVNGETLKEINSWKLLKIRSLVVGDYVVCGPWLGRVERIVDRVTILFNDGAKCEVTASNPDTLVPMYPSIVDDSQFPYHPGQRVKVRLSSVFKSVRWLCGAWNEHRNEGTVCHVEAGLVYVEWVASAMVGDVPGVLAPPHWQEFKNLTLLSCFAHANWQLGDWCILSADGQMVAHDCVFNGASKESVNRRKKLERELGKRNHNSNYEEICVIVKKRITVNVLWQDGIRSDGLGSEFLLPVNIVGDHEFWPEQFVLEKGTNPDTHVTDSQRLGIVKSVDAKERTVKLKWKVSEEGEPNNSVNMQNGTIMSAYELIEHPSFSFCLGDIVFRLPNTVHCQNGQMERETDETAKSFEQCGWDPVALKDNSDDNYLCLIGNVVGLKDEHVEVKWAGGLISKVEPYEIVGIAKYEDPSTASVLQEEDSLENSALEMLAYEKQLSPYKEKDLLEDAGCNSSKDSKKGLWEGSAFSLPREAVGFFAKIAWSLFGSSGSTSLPDSAESSQFGGCSENITMDLNVSPTEVSDAIGCVPPKEQACCILSSNKSNLMNHLPKNLDQQFVTTPKNEGQISSSNLGRTIKFDMAGDYSDHHFVCGANKGSSLPQLKRSWLRKVHQEWSILKENLPDTIFVRAYEERVDLLRAAVVGAPGTPYHDGLFFFDIFLPPDYPQEPPSVHYHSGGLRLNPNLYESGRVCLSLLNTWTGTSTETWNPGNSTILQILVSLQALVLNAKPYFNEAGFDSQIGRADAEKNSTTYNENAFILSCQTMLYHLRKPPKHFEEIVEEHFHRRFHSILSSCKAYMDGAHVGRAFDSETNAQETKTNSSTGFKITLSKLFPKLVAGFTEKGIDCTQFLELKNESIVN